MHIAFVYDDTTKYGDASLVLCYNLAKYMRSQGHDVCIIGHCTDIKDKLVEDVEGIRNYRFYYPINRISNDIFSAYGKNHSLVQLAVRLMQHPITAVNTVLRVFMGKFPIERHYIKIIKKLHNQRPFDVVIACGGAFQPIHALARCRINCKRIGYMLDPHWKHKDNRWYYKREELDVWRNLDKIVVPKLLAREYSDLEMSQYMEKMIVAEFPGIIQHTKTIPAIELETNKINLVFAGNFYKGIRSPQYLFDLMEQMQNNMCLHILGSLYDCGEDMTLHLERLMLTGNVRMHGMLPYAQARTIMHHADVLVNIGNTIDNMLPSKIFEYFSTGKPVIHIKKIANCPCVPYMENYQNALVISEQDPVSENVEKVMAFCQSDLNVLPFETVSSRFRECTISYVADLFLGLSK